MTDVDVGYIREVSKSYPGVHEIVAALQAQVDEVERLLMEEQAVVIAQRQQLAAMRKALEKAADWFEITGHEPELLKELDAAIGNGE